VRYLDFLRELHVALAPPTYLEIGIRRGDSLTLSQSSTIGIDPDFNLKQDAPLEAALFRETSDDYFARPDPLKPFGGRPISLAFIDGMHLVEYALRDFMNVERHAEWSSVVVFDDILPRRPVEAARDRQTRVWTGDVYKMLAILSTHRPDLVCLQVGTKPTGLLLVTGLDPDSEVLSERYEEIVEKAIVPDPQPVPRRVLARRGVIDPQTALSGRFLKVLREERTARSSRDEGMRRMRRAARHDFGRIRSGALRRFVPYRA
jgi:hypothetical protein